jgi:diaminopimelate dehydrogenase
MQRIGIVGYGNLGRGVEAALARCADMQLVGVFTRRDPATVRPLGAATSVHAMSALADLRDAIDVLILCGGSRDDLPVQGPELAATFNTVDSFDTHARIPEYFANVDAAARAGDRTAVIAVGWDPGLFSLTRVLGEAYLPTGTTYTFWGPGVSQGHSDALRRIPGVKAAVQYTQPSQAAIDRVRSGERPVLAKRDAHTRVCFVVLEDGADPAAVTTAIQTMPHYFADDDTRVTFLTEEELRRDHSGIPHGGFVLRSGVTGHDTQQLLELRLALASNPEFTASVLVAYARACARLHRAGERGAKTVFDIAPGLLSPRSPEELRRDLL